MNPRRLYRCRHDRWLAGVAGGMAEYFEVDPTIVRVLWILSAFFGGITILLYIILAFVMPPEPWPMSGMPGYPPAPGASGAGPSGAGPSGAGAMGAGPMGAGTMGATGEPDATPGSSGGPTGDAADPGAPTGAADGIPGWTPPQGWSTSPEWQGPAWTGHRHQSGPDRGSGRTAFGLGVLLVVFGSIALLGAVIPAWTAIGLGPAFILALGVALIVAAARRPARES